MKQIGFLLLAGAFVISAFATALDTVATNWNLFVPAALVGIVGVFLIKRHASGAARSEHVLTANRVELNESLDNIVRDLEQMKEAGDSISVNQLRTEIDDRLRDDLRRFADARESLIHIFSMQTYANVMSDFAAGERYVNRVWSASADGYESEARRYIEKAAAQFRAARQQLESASNI